MEYEFDTWSDEWMLEEGDESEPFWNAGLHIGDVANEPVTMALGYETEQEATDAVIAQYNHMKATGTLNTES